MEFNRDNQRTGIGTFINDAGYKIMASIDLTGKRILEVGAGDIRHLRYLTGLPREYILADISLDMLEFAQKKLADKEILYNSILLSRNQSLPLDDSSVDVIVSFNSLEHLYPLRQYLEDMSRVLRPGGIIVGAIPAEGGLSWGLGRFFTSRQWFKKNTKIDPDKIICWEHPNFADHIINELDSMFIRKEVQFWPLRRIPLLDCNLVLRFCYQKNEA